MNIGFLLFPGLTQLDLTGPYEVFSRLPDCTLHLIWKDLSPVKSDSGLTITPTITMEDCPQLDIICVPGGPGQVDMMEDEEVLAFVHQQGQNAKYVTSVCTGSLILGAAKLLDGYMATTHWSSMAFLEPLGARAINQRVVIDRNRVSGGRCDRRY